MIKTLEYNNEKIHYKLQRKNVKNINIRIKNNIVNISANNSVSEKYIEDILFSKWDWLIKALNKKENIFLQNKEYKYISGEEFLYLGEKYCLNVIKANENKVILNNDLNLYIEDSKDTNTMKRILDNWFLNEMDYVFKDSLKRNYPLITAYTKVKPKLKYRKMTASWGNCRMPSGIITLNKYLIRTPLNFIDYVMVHELVHLVHQNHGKNFYKLLEKLMPDWKIKKEIGNNYN
ncbi:M48 family metallopeptidase [Miniphocaeibacter halophilus]|uniref:M48 family metallopeptidase n=1 Tax=Miniphocaeibacter halophilus TaxID=2931922 RepID=A0AC61N3Q8_9FIRM|nr:SprT family zinc-dependent metalloprotease [Miniphocaeibacter halophilus]QQK08981.1 M48 family metallopeptidase [Miniphocaeibacter halophilus]